MSFNHLKYDDCTYSTRLKENVSILSYVINDDRYNNKSKCRHELGIVGGTAVSHVKGNLVDLESDLRGQTRFKSKCPWREHHPVAPGQKIVNDKTAPIDTSSVHLPACQMISYKQIPLPPAMNKSWC